MYVNAEWTDYYKGMLKDEPAHRTKAMDIGVSVLYIGSRMSPPHQGPGIPGRY